MKEERIIALFKLGEKKYMEELFHEGHIYMNSISYFARTEADYARSDPDEGTSYCFDGEGATFRRKKGNDWTTLGSLSGTIKFRSDNLAKANLYCLHALKEQDYGQEFTLDQLGFGESYVLFLNYDEFQRRIQNAATRLDQHFQSGMVEYVSRMDYTGTMGIFTKFSEFAKQQEFRIVLLPGTGGPLSIKLGDLSDIAIIGNTSERLRLDRKYI